MKLFEMVFPPFHLSQCSPFPTFQHLGILLDLCTKVLFKCIQVAVHCMPWFFCKYFKVNPWKAFGRSCHCGDWKAAIIIMWWTRAAIIHILLIFLRDEKNVCWPRSKWTSGSCHRLPTSITQNSPRECRIWKRPILEQSSKLIRSRLRPLTILKAWKFDCGTRIHKTWDEVTQPWSCSNAQGGNES